MSFISNGKSIFSAKLYIERNLDNDLSGQGIAEHVFSSYFHFQHQFKDSTGESVWRYVKRLRMEKASFLLVYTSLPVWEISILVGFETTASFSKAFSGFYSRSPQKFRNKFQLQGNSIYTPRLDWNTVRKVRQPAQRIISFRSEGIQYFPQGYFKWLHQIDSEKKREITLIGRSPDQPGITLPSKLRWDTAIPENSFNNIFLEDKPRLGFVDYLPAGNYLIIPFVGFGTPLAQNLPGLMKLLYQQGVQWNPSGYSFQILKKHLLQNQCVTELYIPVV